MSCDVLRQCKKVNVQICEFGDVAYFRHPTLGLMGVECHEHHAFRTTADVKKGAELITDYGKEYWEEPAIATQQLEARIDINCRTSKVAENATPPYPHAFQNGKTEELRARSAHGARKSLA